MIKEKQDKEKRRFWTAKRKLEVILECFKEKETVAEVCQIYYHTIEGEHESYSSGKYQNNNGIQPSLLYKDFKN